MQKNKVITIIVLIGVIIIMTAVYFFTIRNTPPSLKVISPMRGDILIPGSVYHITWESTNIPASNKISIVIRRIPPPPLQEEGQEFDPIIFTNLPNTGNQDWIVSDMYPAGNYVLGINSYASLPMTDTITAESAQFSIQGKTSGIGLKCYDSPKYFAIEKSLADSVGSNILIKYKTNPSQNIPCTYTVAGGDFELKNIVAEYFLTFTDTFLVLDKGTAPEPRGLVVYDLRSRKMVFTDSYAKPVSVEGDTLTYFSTTKQKPTLQNCPDLNDYTEKGLGAVIMSKVTVELPSLTKKDIGILKCMATQ